MPQSAANVLIVSNMPALYNSILTVLASLFIPICFKSALSRVSTKSAALSNPAANSSTPGSVILVTFWSISITLITFVSVVLNDKIVLLNRVTAALLSWKYLVSGAALLTILSNPFANRSPKPSVSIALLKCSITSSISSNSVFRAISSASTLLFMSLSASKESTRPLIAKDKLLI